MAGSRFRTLSGSVSSLVVWAVHFAAVYSLVGVGCNHGWHRVSLIGTNALTMLLAALTVPALVLIAWIGLRGWRSYRSAGRRGDLRREDAGRWRFLGLVTLTLALLAFVSTIMTALPIVMLPPCD